MTEQERRFDGIPADLLEALRRLARTSELTVALDFDGVLAPLVDRPSEARSRPESEQAIRELVALKATKVALVSGRALESLRTVSGSPENVLLIGSHGAEYDLGDGRVGAAMTAEERRALSELEHAVLGVVSRHPDVRVEQKPTGYALHTRGLPHDVAQQAQRDASRSIGNAVPGVTSRAGKDVLEFSVVRSTKGDAMQRLRLHTAATSMLYAGDDVTDEDAFAALEPGDVAVKVGQGSSVAPFRVRSTEDVSQMLRLLAGARRNHLLGVAASARVARASSVGFGGE
ncbi:trehalose 6-phosphatase [Paramicrobacterium humi]|uniref:Trehalose 6-phosphate phosphatase n=1 Tax=Paramicrobacterium humi TaxID=640635 RepID=A0A1H4TFZ2_9MICO|nr:trehalose-phosphatase [Microbacterium humi]SEC55071.1 trehalose 6-phosphatase [Microbacterium humi]